MTRLREERHWPLGGRSIWEASGRGKLLALVLLSTWVGTKSITSVGSPNHLHSASPGGYSDPLSSDRSKRSARRTLWPEDQYSQANRDAIRHEASIQPATLSMEEGAGALRCLALNVYWEARNQSVAGQLAVAQVTMNRVSDPRYGNDVCEVVYEHKQFSWYWDGKSDAPKEYRAWERALLVASAALDGAGHAGLKGVTHYHAVYSRPFWKDHLVRVARIDDHVFYTQ